MIEGVDYSATANANWDVLAASLKAAGKHFVGRYAVSDKSPDYRGITREEYAAMRDANIDVFLYWQSSGSWMLGGFDAGAAGARNAQANINAAGMPTDTPVYFACDFDAYESQQGVIDECLRGAASVLGKNRVGLYAGYHVLKRAKENGSAVWFCQTTAWSGGMIMPGLHLYQYAYNQYVYGTNCDWVRAYQENYGQATPPKPIPPSIYPRDMSYELARELFGERVVKFDGNTHNLHFDPNGPISQAWLQLIKEQLQPGESYRKAVIGPLTRVIRRGADKRFWDISFTGMPSIRYDSQTKTVVG